MLTIILFLLMILSGSFFACISFNKRFEEILPISTTLMIAISFLFGIFGLLKYSIYALLAITIMLYGIGIYKIVKNGKFNEFITNFFTPGFLIYIILSIFFLVTIKGKMFDSWDEFSHWGDIVKVMTTIDDFGTNPMSKSIFQTYPPGMSLFQYLIEKLNYLVYHQVFTEWLAYFAYYILAIAYIVPITKKFAFKNIFAILTYIVSVIFVPFIFFNGIYYQLYIDPFLSFLIVGGFTILFLDEQNCLLSYLLVSCNIFMLVLAKDVGLLFAIVLVFFSIIKITANDYTKDICKNNLAVYATLLISLLAPKLLWNLNISMANAKAQFSNKIDFVNLINVLLGKDNSYRYTVLKNFITAFITKGIAIGNTGIFVNYASLLVISFATIILVNGKSRKANRTVVNIGLITSSLIFIVGTCVSYMYKFSESEAVSLASFGRYLNIVFLAMWLYICLVSIINHLIDSNGKSFYLVLLCLLFVTSPLEIIVPYSMRSTVKASANIRSNYSEIIDKTLEHVDGDDEVWFIAQETQGFERLVYKFGIRPNMNDAWWSIGEPFYDGDEYTQTINCDEWVEELVKNFDYVALYKLNDYFYENFSLAFDNADEIKENSLYKVDKVNKKLVLCE